MKISKKIYSSIWNSDLNVFSSIIKKIAFITIAIGLSSIILSVFILEGFKKEIKRTGYSVGNIARREKIFQKNC